jgi:hypothetical protein
MNATSIPTPRGRTAALAALLVVASVALTLGFACALPLAAFAVMSAMLFGPAAAVGSIVTVWLANQIVGFTYLGYPTDLSTLAWGAALGAIALLSLASAGAVLARVGGFVGIGASFILAFVVYQGAIYAACLASGTDVSHFTVTVVTRVFLINAAAFGGFLALRALWLRSASGRESRETHAIRHA